jgi:hypothetical protein
MKTNTPAPSVVAAYTLKDAVLDAVNSLKSNGTFSAHDVTTTIRNAVNDGEYILPGLEAASGSAFKYNVDHDAVKQVIDSVLNDGTLANLGLVNVNYDGDYRTFEFDNTPVDEDEDVTTTTTAAPVGTAAPANATVDDDAAVSDNDGPVAKRITAYLQKVGSATLKQVQSALKVNGLTCKDLATLADELGFTVEVGTEGCYSTYTVSE